MEANHMLLNNEWVDNDIKKEVKKTLKQIKMRTQQLKICGKCIALQAYLKTTRKSSNKQSNLTLKGT